MEKIVIIGAGPAGLTAAYELLKNKEDYEVTILEESNEIGGISRTVKYNGNRMDIGGHRFFSKDERIMNLWKEIMPVQGKPSFDDEILEYRMLKFIMQTLVENAIYHGIKSKNEYGKLTIRGYKDKNMLIFVIKDTGKGMDEDTLTKLYQRINEKKRDEKENRGYGIWNVNQRIKLYYGEQYGLQIDSIVDKGTSIYIKIPAEI